MREGTVPDNYFAAGHPTVVLETSDFPLELETFLEFARKIGSIVLGGEPYPDLFFVRPPGLSDIVFALNGLGELAKENELQNNRHSQHRLN